MGMKNVLSCFLLLVLVFGACFHLPFVAFYCSSLLFLVFEIESILSQKPKQANAFCCSLWLFVARFGFCGCFHLSIALLVVAFRWYVKPKRATKGKKISKSKPGFNKVNDFEPVPFSAGRLQRFCLYQLL